MRVGGDMSMDFRVLEGVGLGMGCWGARVSSACALCTALALPVGELTRLAGGCLAWAPPSSSSHDGPGVNG